VRTGGTAVASVERSLEAIEADMGTQALDARTAAQTMRQQAQASAAVLDTDLLSNIEYSGCRFSYPRECHHGTENLWGFVETAEACFNEVHHPVQVREHLVPDVVLADVFPDMLGWVQLRAIGWQRYQGHVGWDHEVVGFVPSGAIEQHDAVFTGELC
jgi:hypothetical protein